MNQGRIWCVVHPTVGLPLLLGSVALTSLAVHTAIMTHTSWMGNYWSGSKARTAMEGNGPAQAMVTPQAGSAFSMTVTPVPANGALPASFIISVAPNSGATAVTPAADTTAHPPSGTPLHTASVD